MARDYYQKLTIVQDSRVQFNSVHFLKITLGFAVSKHNFEAPPGMDILSIVKKMNFAVFQKATIEFFAWLFCFSFLEVLGRRAPRSRKM